MTRIVRFRRITLHFSHIGLTLGRTFIGFLSIAGMGLGGEEDWRFPRQRITAGGVFGSSALAPPEDQRRGNRLRGVGAVAVETAGTAGYL